MNDKQNTYFICAEVKAPTIKCVICGEEKPYGYFTQDDEFKNFGNKFNKRPFCQKCQKSPLTVIRWFNKQLQAKEKECEELRNKNRISNEKHGLKPCFECPEFGALLTIERLEHHNTTLQNRIDELKTSFENERQNLHKKIKAYKKNADGELQNDYEIAVQLLQEHKQKLTKAEEALEIIDNRDIKAGYFEEQSDFIKEKCRNVCKLLDDIYYHRLYHEQIMSCIKEFSNQLQREEDKNILLKEALEHYSRNCSTCSKNCISNEVGECEYYIAKQALEKLGGQDG